MDDALGFGALDSVGVNMGHNVVADQLFLGFGYVVIDVILVGFQFVDLLLGDGKT